MNSFRLELCSAHGHVDLQRIKAALDHIQVGQNILNIKYKFILFKITKPFTFRLLPIKFLKAGIDIFPNDKKVITFINKKL